MLRCGRYITPLLPPVQLIPRKVRQFFFYLFSTFVYIFVWRDASHLMAKLIAPPVNCICQKQVSHARKSFSYNGTYKCMLTSNDDEQ